MADYSPTELLPEGEWLYVNEWQAAVIFFLGAFVVLSGIAALLAGHGRYHQNLVWIRYVAGASCIIVGGLLAAGSRSGLTVDQDGITVQRALTRKRWLWGQVKGFEIRQRLGTNGRWLRIELLDGTGQWVPGFNARTKEQRALVDARVAELNRRSGSAVGSLT